MDDDINIPVNYNGKELLFPSKLLLTGYSYKIQVDVYGQEVLFEPDEERTFRALLHTEDLEKGRGIDVHLLQAIAMALEAIGKE